MNSPLRKLCQNVYSSNNYSIYDYQNSLLNDTYIYEKRYESTVYVTSAVWQGTACDRLFENNQLSFSFKQPFLYLERGGGGQGQQGHQVDPHGRGSAPRPQGNQQSFYLNHSLEFLFMS